MGDWKPRPVVPPSDLYMKVKGLEDTPASVSYWMIRPGEQESTFLAFEPSGNCDFQVELPCGVVQRVFTPVIDP